MKSCRALALSSVAAALWSAAATAQPLPSLHIHPVEIGKDGSGIAFIEPGGVVDDGAPRTLDATTTAGRFSFGVDISALRWADDCQCLRHYVFFVRPRDSVVTTRFKVKGKPTGRFADHWEEVAFDVDLGGRRDTGRARLPVQAPQPDVAKLVQVNAGAVHTIGLHGERHVRFELKNTLSDTPIDVSLPPIVRTDHGRVLGVWAVDPTSTRRIGPGTTSLVDVVVRPKSTGAALLASLGSGLAAASQADVIAEFRYVNPEIQGRDESLTAITRVRFSPDPVVIAVGALLGILLVLGAARLVPRFAPRRTRA